MPRVVVVAYPGVMVSAVFGVQELFAVANRYLAEGRATFAVDVVAVGGAEGPATTAALSPAEAGTRCDAVIVPPRLSAAEPVFLDGEATDWLMRCHRQGAVVTSVCVGAFLLAEAGILDGRCATTHWLLEERFRRGYPKVRLDTARMLIDEGDVITAGGVSAYQDLAVHLVGRLAGPGVAVRTSRHMLVDPLPRAQSLFRRFVPDFGHGDAAVVRAQQYMHRHYRGSVSVGAVSAAAGLAERTLLRRFRRATGHSPSAYLQRLRVDQGCELLETTDASVETIAYRVGYEDAAAFRKLFRTITGLPAGQYRKRFRVGDAEPDTAMADE